MLNIHAVAFKIYDVDGDGFVGLGDLEAILRMMVGAHLSPERLLVIAKRTLAAADKGAPCRSHRDSCFVIDGDGRLSLEEFAASLSDYGIESKLSIHF
jgi:serine/threonine-protein phosphatase 2B regulatory subunit